MAANAASLKLSKKLWYFMAGALLLLAALLIITKKTQAATPTYDPWADSVANVGTLVSDANNAVGAPNGTAAQMGGVGSSLTLDMGAGEEGTQTLKVYFTSVNAIVNLDVDFLNAGGGVIKSENRQLGINPNPSTQNFAYNWTDFKQAYRFVRLKTAVGGGANIDAVEALGFIGSTPTQDTDGDGTPDRVEQQTGRNPLVPDAPSSTSHPSAPGSNSTAGSTSGTSSGQVNPPPSASQDKDKDGMNDAWEKAHGLNPNDPNDANLDPDHDGLVNLTEFQIGSDPNKMDTDGDGMPDKWEFDHGLNVLKNDADGDLDGDHLTNLGEFIQNTDPNKADDLYQVFARPCTSTHSLSGWDWFWVILLVAGAAIAWLKAASIHRNEKKGSSSSSDSDIKYIR